MSGQLLSGGIEAVEKNNHNVVSHLQTPLFRNTIQDNSTACRVVNYCR